MKILTKLPLLATILAFLLAAIGLLSSLREFFLALFALVPLASAINLLRKRSWGGYGFALVQAAQILSVLLLLWRGEIPIRVFAATAGFNLLLVLLFFFAGRSLSIEHHPKGWRFPWIAAAILMLVPLFFFRPVLIPSAGMEDTLLIGDRVVVRTFPSFNPSRGDIVAFYYPADRRQIYIKRVLGVPGDHIRIASKRLYVNGVALAEPYAVHKSPSIDSYRDNFPNDPSNIPAPAGSPMMRALKEMLDHHVQGGEVVVPANRYFVLGDNRDNSLDSRYWGFLAASDLIGKPFLIYDSKQQPVSSIPIPGAATVPVTRWNRILKWF